jgi:L-fuconolactonase
MLDIPIIDTHVHLWNPAHFRMSWTDDNALLNRPYTAEIYHEQTNGVQVDAMVFVECGVELQYAFLEARWAVEGAHADPHIQGIIAAAPVEFGLLTRSYLAALTALGPLIKGVRRNLQDESDIEACLNHDFVRGVQLLSEYRLSFDLCIRHWQLPATITLVSRCPETQFILDHLGKPNVKEHLLDPWRDQMRELAALPNVACKLSGLVTEADLSAWQPEDLAPYLLHVLEVFGEDRVTFGGDWPVVLLASPYKLWVETLQAVTASMALTARRKLWNENARRLYRLQDA